MNGITRLKVDRSADDKDCCCEGEFRHRIHSLFLFLFPGDAHLIVSICLLMRLSTPALASIARRDKRFHPLQQQRQEKVTLEVEESVGGSRK
jgi:hypothetical protein